MAEVPPVKLKELASKVEQIRQKLDALSRSDLSKNPAEERTVAGAVPAAVKSKPEVLAKRAAAIYASRSRRATYFDVGADLFADPAWDIMLDLYCNEHAKRTTTISSACIAARVPQTTGLRWINLLVEYGLVVRVPHPLDRRCSQLHLTEKAIEALERVLFAWLIEAPRRC